MKFTSRLFSVLLVVLTVLAATNSFAAAKRGGDKGKIGPAGCGLGYMVLGGKDMPIVAATLNGTGVQTFGITTGTSDCDQGGRDMAILNYIQNNKIALEKDIARGQGESIVALAQVTGCANESQLSSALKGHYSEIFPAAELPAVQITDSIKHVIHNNPALASTCAPLS